MSVIDHSMTSVGWAKTFILHRLESEKKSCSQVLAMFYEELVSDIWP